MVDSKENYKFDLGAKGLRTVKSDWLVSETASYFPFQLGDSLVSPSMRFLFLTQWLTFSEESTGSYTAALDQSDNGHTGLLCLNKRHSHWQTHELQTVWSSQTADFSHFAPQCDWSQHLSAGCHIFIDLQRKWLVWHYRWFPFRDVVHANSTCLHGVHNICAHAAV